MSLVQREALKRSVKKELKLDPGFGAQNAFILDTSRYITAQCSRRAGKTNGLAIRFFNTLKKYPGSQCPYLALTRESAKDIMWPVLQELNEIYNLGCTFTESKLTMTHPNGAQLKLYGADMKNFIKRLKGRKFPGIGVDEAQDYGPHLQSLVDDVLTPCIADYEDGWLALTGTPGPVPSGYFFEITHNRRFGYSHHEWTILENPFMPSPEDFISQLMKKREWEDNNPTLLREWRNKWVLDVNSLWVQYKESVNHFSTMAAGEWTCVMGIDIGYKDADAIAVLAWNPNSPTTYLVEESIKTKQGLTELVEDIRRLSAKYNVGKMIIDEGGLGKKLAEEMRRRHHIPVEAAEKQRKQETVEFLNDALRLGHFKAQKNSRFAQDSYLIQVDWDKTTPDKVVIKKQPHSDIIDAVLYAFKASPAYAYQTPAPIPKPGTKEHYDAITDDMEQKAEEYFKELEEASKDPYDGLY